MRVIGVTGYAQHGKDTFGQRLVTAHGFKRYAFADALKSMALALDPIVWGDTNSAHMRLSKIVAQVGWEQAKQHAEVRRFLQVLGTEGVRGHLGDNAWVDALHHKLLVEKPEAVVITDVRFPNEADFIHALGGKLVRVKRFVRRPLAGGDGWADFEFAAFDNGLPPDHPSEANVPTLDADVEMLNDGTDFFLTLIDDYIDPVYFTPGFAIEDGEPLSTEYEALVDERPPAKRHYQRLDKVADEEHIDGGNPFGRYA